MLPLRASISWPLPFLPGSSRRSRTPWTSRERGSFWSSWRPWTPWKTRRARTGWTTRQPRRQRGLWRRRTHGKLLLLWHHILAFFLLLPAPFVFRCLIITIPKLTHYIKSGCTGISLGVSSKCSAYAFVAFRVLMVLQAQLELQDREASWVFLVREESAGCQAFQDLRSVSFLILLLLSLCHLQDWVWTWIILTCKVWFQCRYSVDMYRD